MSDVTLSAAVRNNLLALQNTASMMATAQNQLATGKKVNSALDNPTNFFTASSLDSRANDLTSLLDGVSNGVQTLQAADTGITGITSLVNQLQATARQALQASASYSSKATITSAAITGITASSLLGGTTNNASTTSSTAFTSAGLAATSAGTPTAPGNVTGTAYSPQTATGTKTLTLNGTTLSINMATADTDSGGTVSEAEAVTAIQSAIDTAVSGGATALTGITVSDSGGALQFSSTATGSSAEIDVGGTDAAAFGLDALTATHGTDGTSTPADTLTIAVGSTTKTFTYVSSGADASAGTFTTLTDLQNAVAQSTIGSQVAVSDSSGDVKVTAADSSTSFTLGGSAATKLGLATTLQSSSTTGSISGQTLTVTGPGSSTPTTITFGTGAGQVSTLAQLNSSLASLDLTATITKDNKLQITTANSAGAEDFSTSSADTNKYVIGGTIAATGAAFNGATTVDAVLNGDGADARNNFVTQYNSLLGQIDSLAQDSSYNGVNLLNGDDLTITMNETGSSKLDIQGVNDSSTGLNLTALANADFQDSDSINKVLSVLNNAVNTLRSQSSQFGSNLSVVQTRQDFTNSLVNVLQTGSANLTTADTNQVSANLLALQTRQQLSTTALSMASQADQNVLRLFQ